MGICVRWIETDRGAEFRYCSSPIAASSKLIGFCEAIFCRFRTSCLLSAKSRLEDQANEYGQKPFCAIHGDLLKRLFLGSRFNNGLTISPTCVCILARETVVEVNANELPQPWSEKASD